MKSPPEKEASELKACPFCGEQPEIYHDLTLDWVIRCDYRRCGARASVNSSPKEKAIAAWNTRHDSRSSVLDEVLEEFSDRIKYTDWAEDGYTWLKQIIQKAKEQKR